MSAEPLAITIDGIIGVGKTTLAKAMAAHLGAVRFLEDEFDNPFLDGFYRQPQRYGLACQLWFLDARLKQLSQPVAQGLPVVTDHLLAKDAVFADLTLSDEELDLYLRMAERMVRGPLFQPQVIVYLRADLDEVSERIAQRGRADDGLISQEYLLHLSAAYDRIYNSDHNLPAPSVVIVSNHGEGVAFNEEAVARLIDACRNAPKGVSYCNPVA